MTQAERKGKGAKGSEVMHVRVPSALKEEIEAIAVEERRSLSNAVAVLLESAVAQRRKRGSTHASERTSRRRGLA
jgi:hypothetical protein